MKTRLWGFSILASLALAILLLFSLFSSGPEPATAAGDVIPGRYIVVLQRGVNPASFAAAQGVRANVIYSHALNGFTAPLSDAAAAALVRNPNVLSVEPDRIVTLDLHGNAYETLPTGVDRIDAETWGGNVNTTGNTSLGPEADIDIAIIDTGINTDHPDLRYAGGAGLTCAISSGSNEDDNGHGSHVAGSAAAKDNAIGVIGVAPGAALWAVKVLDSSGRGSLSCVIAGIDWVTANAATIEVANMSLGCACSTSAGDTALANSVAAGVVYAVAAGNSDANASTFWPANHPNVIAVSAIADYNGVYGGGAAATCNNYGPDDSFATFSNFGSVVDIAAPGVCIVSTYGDTATCTNCYATLSGTSMASPHVAGAVARFKLPSPIGTGYSGSADGPTVVAAMTAAGWTVPQSSACGFTGDPDAYPEPLVWLGAACSGGSNTAPTANNTSATTNEDTAVAITLSGSDAETCELTFSIVSAPTKGSLSSIANNTCSGSGPYTDSASVTYTPNANTNGSDSFTFRVNDGAANSNDATVSITVNPVPDPPVANSQSVTTSQNSAVTITLAGSDVDGCADQTFTFNVTGGPTNGTLNATAGSMACTGTGSLSASVTYTPATSYTGPDSFTFKVNDGTFDSNTATVSITVAPACAAPTITSASDTNPSKGGTVSFTWNPVPGATQYTVQRQKNDGTWSTRQTSSATSFAGQDSGNDPLWRVFVSAGTCTPIPGPTTVFDPELP